MKSFTTHTGGTVTFPAPGVLRHVAGKAYSGQIAAKEAAQKPVK